MRSYRRTPAKRRGGNDGSFWLSFSDLMSSLMVIIILVMFYMIYQYFNMMELNQAELARRQFDLDQAQAELETNQGKLTEAEQQMIAQQILLNAREAELKDAQAVLASQKEELEQAEKDLAAIQAQLDAQGAEISRQQAVLDDQQRQIEQLIGLKPRIITALKGALQDSGISATVDQATGSIALKSDVLFESGRYKLTPAGQDFVDKFLPIYLEVLFSEDYSGYVSEIIIEGHTDSDGGYLSNLELSQQRALAVASYVLSDECTAISASTKTQLRDMVTVNGKSFTDRIIINGVEDKDASRRVVFKFRLTDEQMIQQLQAILEAE